MRRITIMLPSDLDDRVRREARRRGLPIADVVREAVALHLPERPSAVPGFFAVGDSDRDDASETVDEFVAAAIGRETNSGSAC